MDATGGRRRGTGRQASSTAARLVADVGGGAVPKTLTAELEAWIDGSPRFRVFVEANGTKIRRKLREAADPEAIRDVRTELLVATRLLSDRRIELAFEAYGSRRPGPDFTVTFRDVTRFNVEVTRRRGTGDGPAVVDATIAKLRQLPPSMANVLVVAVEGPVALDEVNRAFRELRARVDARDPGILARVRAERPRDFYERFLRLAAAIAWAPDAPAAGRAVAWKNPSARIDLERDALAALVDRLAG